MSELEGLRSLRASHASALRDCITWPPAPLQHSADGVDIRYGGVGSIWAAEVRAAAHCLASADEDRPRLHFRLAHWHAALLLTRPLAALLQPAIAECCSPRHKSRAAHAEHADAAGRHEQHTTSAVALHTGSLSPPQSKQSPIKLILPLAIHFAACPLSHLGGPARLRPHSALRSLVPII